MKKTVFWNSPIVLAIFFIFSSNTIVLNRSKLSNEALTLLKVVVGIHYTFHNFADEIWPGYDLSKDPYIAYLPGEFVLYINAKHAPAGFEPYPSDWPDLGTKSFIHYGVFRDLVAQFAFDFQIDSITTFAMGLPKNLIFSFTNPAFMLLSSTIHEGFHQYQHDHFGEIPWAREEKYPILDIENTALASLEMLVIEDALKAMFDQNQIEMEELLKEFTAVRDYRWKRTDNFIRKYEQGQEINEGTARYVEMKALECFMKLNSETINNSLLKDIKKDLATISIKDLLTKDMESRLMGSAVAPEDMLRNRIYPVGASLGFLLDGLKIDWKMKFQSAGSTVSFPYLLMKHFELDSTQLTDYLVKAKTIYHYQKIYSTAKNHINEYLVGYQKALEKFNNQHGTRIEINLSNNGILRFRSSKDKKWIVEKGKITLCLNYNLYSIKTTTDNGLLLEIRDKAILDENDWEKKRKKVVFYSNHLSSLIIDGIPTKLTKDIEQRFKKIRIEGDSFSFESEIEGRYFFKNNVIIINLE